MAYNNNAYKFDSNATRAPKRAPKRAIIKIFPERKQNNSANRKIVASCLVAIAIAFMMCFNIYLRTEINDTNKAIAEADKEISTLMSVKTQLNVKLEKLVSYSTLEQQATALGMQKCSKSQIHYIDTSSDDYAEIIDN